MIVICKPEESMEWFNKMWSYSVELFQSLDIPVRTLECCTGDLADLKVKSYDVEAWSPKQQKYFEVCSCSHMLIAFLENNLTFDGEYYTVKIPAALQPYMGGKTEIKAINKYNA